MADDNTRAQLRDAGLRVTAQRASVLDALRIQPHVTADAVARWVREHGVTISTQGVYDVLDALTAVGLTRRIEPAGSAAVYEARVGDNHHHLVCRTCGAIVDVDCVVGSASCLVPTDSHGFAVDEAEVVFWGVCPECLRLSS
ncbi:Fur family transcriptional regulator [Cryptosporangium sp. NPDC048952]|uniref:Fur family transcriptional regulator n=1 Tax=Cryptosporangium sp. NPDC048952 TaxID=3363961 RepID=UPI00371CEEEC